MRLATVLASCALGLACGAATALHAQEEPPAAVAAEVKELRRQLESQSFALQQLQRKVDDVLWFDRVGDVARIDKVYIPTVPVPKQAETYGISNARHPFRMWSYVFVPRRDGAAGKLPLLLLPHGGVHGDFDTYYTHVVRELLEEGYVVVARVPTLRAQGPRGRARGAQASTGWTTRWPSSRASRCTTSWPGT